LFPSFEFFSLDYNNFQIYWLFHVCRFCKALLFPFFAHYVLFIIFAHILIINHFYFISSPFIFRLNFQSE
jgi:hypothetical protein